MMTAGSLNPWVQAINNFGDSARNMQDILTRAEELKKNKFIRETYQNTPLPQQGSGGVESYPGSTFNTPGGSTTGSGGGGAGDSGRVSSYTADDTMDPVQRALLDSIAGPESGGRYNARWPSKSFDDFSKHPNILEPGPQGPSSAAGRYQIVGQTWRALQEKYGYKDFLPQTQDKAAWQLASDTYMQKTGRDLLADLKANQTGLVASALGQQWPTIGKAMSSFSANLSKYNNLNKVADVREQPSGGMALPPPGMGAPATAAAPTPAPSARTRPGGKTIPRAAMAALQPPSGLRPHVQTALAQPGPFDNTAGVQPQMAALYDRPQAPPPASVLQQLAMNQALPASPYEEESAYASV